MRFDISYDENGNPIHVTTDNGFCQTSRPFDKSEDGWMLDQLNYNEFPIIGAGMDVRFLVDEVNRLRREVYRLEKSNARWMKASGFGEN